MGRAFLFLGLAGYLWWFGEALFDSFPMQPRDVWSIGSAAILLVVVPLAAFFLLRHGSTELVRRPMLLLPLGILHLTGAVLPIVALGPWYFSGDSFSVLGITITVSVSVVLLLLLAVGYASWMTRALLEPNLEQPVSLERFLRDFLRAFAVMVTCGVVLLVGGAVCLQLGSLSMVSILLWGLVWNGLTVALLPVALTAPSIQEGIRRARAAALRPRLWLLVFVQSSLLGMLVYLAASGTDVSANTTTSWTRNGWYTQAEWLGGYADSFHWHDKLMANLLKAREFPLATFQLAILGAALAIVVKIEVIRELRKANMLDA